MSTIFAMVAPSLANALAASLVAAFGGIATTAFTYAVTKGKLLLAQAATEKADGISRIKNDLLGPAARAAESVVNMIKADPAAMDAIQAAKDAAVAVFHNEFASSIQKIGGSLSGVDSMITNLVKQKINDAASIPPVMITDDLKTAAMVKATTELKPLDNNAATILKALKK